MNTSLLNKTDYPSPYVWMKSPKLRSPHISAKPFSPDVSLQMRGRPCFGSDSISKPRNILLLRPIFKPVSTAIGHTGGRKVKTAASEQLFQTSKYPTHSYDNGDARQTEEAECEVNIDATGSCSQKKQESQIYSGTGWGRVLPPLPVNDEGVTEDGLKPHHNENGLLYHEENGFAHHLTLLNNDNFNIALDQKVNNPQDKESKSSSRKNTQINKSVFTVVDRAGQESPSLQRRTLSRSSNTSRYSDFNHLKPCSKRAASASSTRYFPNKIPDPVLTLRSSRARAATSIPNRRRYIFPEKNTDSTSCYPDKDIKKVRPVTVGNAGDTAKRYCDKRLQAIYASRRARSAVGSCSRPVTLESRSRPATSTSSPETKHGQAKSLSPNSRPHDTEDELRQESQSPKSDEHTRKGSGKTSPKALTPIARFRLLAWITVCMRRLLVEIIKLSGEKTLRSATELQWMAVYAEKHDASLAFNKHLFSRDRVMAHVPFWAQCILAIPPADRTVSHCRKLHALLRGLRSFDKFTDEIQMALCKAFILEKIEEGRIVLKNGHIGLNFYFIYSGSVFVNQEDETRQGRVFSRTVATLTRGDSFGELALLQDIRRTATVSVRERCELLMVDKDVFASVCPRIFDKELAEKHAFIKCLDLFSSSYWSPEAIHALSMNSQIQEYKINKIIVGDSSLEDWIYICMFGKCQVIRVLSLKKTRPEGELPRKESDVVLSEEILQLLASATGQSTSGEPLDRGDSKENLLSSLQLDYVRTSKKLYVAGGKDNAQQKALLGLNDATTLTAYIQRQRDMGKTDLVYLNVGVLEAGQTFDLPSLLDGTPSSTKKTSTLMLVSGGARLVRIKKAAFHDQASQQALDNARTLASKQVSPTEQSILESYKTKIAWEDFKASLVHEVKHKKTMRYQPVHRADLNLQYFTEDTHRKQRSDPKSGSKSSKIISALWSIHKDGEEEIRRQSICKRTSSAERWARSRPPPSVTFQRRKSLSLEDMKSGSKKELVISRRQSPQLHRRRRISKEEREGTSY